MHSSRNHLLDTITQELHLPEIDPDACVHSLFDQADCQACVDICPTQAWVLDDNALGLDTGACDGCGLCVPACPSGALHVHYPWVIRPFGGQLIALFACEKSDIEENAGTLPCIHALGLRQLLLLHNSGIDYLLVATGDCTDCTRHQTAGIHQLLEHLNSLLRERDKPPMKILQRSNQVWMRIFRSDEMITRGTQLSRREFLHGGGQQIRRQLVVLDPLNLNECRIVPPGQLLPTTESDDVHWPWVTSLDESRCNGCDACAKLCPTPALQLSQDDEESAYQLDPRHCTGCGICTAVCDLQAITISSWSVSADSTIKLVEKECTACGSTFHLPRNNSQSQSAYCRICRKHNHNSKLFQVLSNHP